MTSTLMRKLNHSADLVLTVPIGRARVCIKAIAAASTPTVLIMRLGLVLLALTLTLGLGSFFPVKGTRSKITIFIKHLYLAIDANDNTTLIGTTDASSVYNVFHRVSLSSKHLLLVNSITCKCVCINSCGYVYTASVPNKDCELTESVTSSYHNCYYKERYDTNGTETRSYLAMNRLGHTKRIQTTNNDLPANRESHINVIFGEWNDSFVVDDYGQDTRFGSCRLTDYAQSRNLKTPSNRQVCDADIDYDNGKRQKNVYTVEEDQQRLNIKLLPSQDPVGLRTFTTEMYYNRRPTPNPFVMPEPPQSLTTTTTTAASDIPTLQKPTRNMCISY
ncbi:fgf [Leucania separata nucleopolyhedrovirus]|uniref:Fgf n=1 Tax=Leucania separata nucleopolyhedrovirus TaxID=1307956 RepID=Q0IKX3_NPVLS|nr:fgf [Leucania separata nucleopolyhedrovirus]AAR28910.1 fgf [Leucania separata nucleopolyhedrovirus]